MILPIKMIGNNLPKLSKKQFENHIRQAAKESINVSITVHALARMNERGINRSMVLDVLKHGLIRKTPEPDIKHPGTKCQVERYVSGINVAVVVNVDFPSEGLIVITVFEVTRG